MYKKNNNFSKTSVVLLNMNLRWSHQNKCIDGECLYSIHFTPSVSPRVSAIAAPHHVCSRQRALGV